MSCSESSSCGREVHQAIYDDDEEQHCRSCHSTAIITDWAQGDRICTNCGVVAESRLCDSRPEWKSFNETEDIVRGLTSGRSGLVPVDESRYVGGLQPTSLSKNPFGQNSSGGGYKMTKLRKQLSCTNRKLDNLMAKTHKRALNDAQLDRKVRLKKEKENASKTSILSEDVDSSVQPELDMVILQEEEDAQRLQSAIYTNKWSLDRAILLNDTSQDVQKTHALEEDGHRDFLLSQMDTKSRNASRDLYNSYSMTTQAARKLKLPSQVINQAINLLVSYVTRRDGFLVKGISSRLSKDNGNQSRDERKVAAARLRELNKMKQISSLGAAVLFVTARNLGWTRTALEICGHFRFSLGKTKECIVIKPKHCFSAINEMKAFFPKFAMTASIKNGTNDSYSSKNDSISTSNFADHFIRNLQLPPVAEASIRVLLVHCRHEQIEIGRNSGIKMSAMCAAVTYFVCAAGSVMQNLAKQVQSRNNNGSPANHKNSYLSTAKLKNESELSQQPEILTKDDDNGNNDDGVDDNGVGDFDVFTHTAVIGSHQEKIEYDMRRMWDAWFEQMPWSRSLQEIEQSCGISRNVILNLYKNDMYPRRDQLLKVLTDAVSTTDISRSKSEFISAPLAKILLAHISTGTLMSST